MQCGLDKSRRGLEATPFEHQLDAFREQLRIAQRLGRTLSVSPCTSGGGVFPIAACRAACAGLAAVPHPALHPLPFSTTPPPLPIPGGQIHCVRAHGRLLEVLRDEHPTVPLVLHAWSGSAELAGALRAAFPRTAFFSLSGHILAQAPEKAVGMVSGVAPGFRGRGFALQGGRERGSGPANGTPHRSTTFTTPPGPPILVKLLDPHRHQMRAVPLERLLLETDAPDGQLRLSDAWRASGALAAAAPLDGDLLRRLGPRNSPEALPQLLHIVAAARGQPPAGLAEATWSNACAVFGAP